MNLKSLSLSEAVTAIYRAKKSYQAFNLLSKHVLKEESSASKIIIRLKTGRKELAPGSPEFNFCEAFISQLENKASQRLSLKEYFIICAELKGFSDPLQRTEYYFKNRPLPLGEYIILAFEEKNIYPALRIIEKNFWDSSDKLSEVRQMFSDAEAELTLGSPEQTFCQKMAQEIKQWETLSTVKFVEIILWITNWTNKPARMADDYVNGDARRRVAAVAVNAQLSILSAALTAEREGNKGFFQRLCGR